MIKYILLNIFDGEFMFELYKLSKFENKLFNIKSLKTAEIDISKSIHDSNRRMLRISSLLMLIVFSIMMILSFFLDTYKDNRLFYILETTSSLIVFVLSTTILKKHPLANQIILYFFVSSLYYYGIHVGIIAQQVNYAVTACLFLAVLPMLFITRPFLVFLIATIWMIVTIALLVKYKVSSILVVDLTDVVFSWFMGVGLGITINRLKIENFIHEKQISMERDVDGLTGLLNKIAFEKKVKDLLIDKNTEGAFLIMDLDNFKSINDINGHSYGDQVLVEVSKCILKTFENKAVLGRFGGDEFVFFIPNISTAEAEATAKKILENLYNQVTNSVQGSIGIAMHTNEMEKNYDLLLIKADRALYATKAQGRFGYTLYSEVEMTKKEVVLDRNSCI